jgi:AraC-like DNA-binding protein
MAVMGTFFMLEQPPEGNLRGRIERIVGFGERTGVATHRRELPHPGFPVIISFGDRIRIDSAAGAGVHTSFLAGLHQIPVDTVHEGQLRCVQVDLTPFAAYRLLGMPLTELADTVVDLRELPGIDWGELAERVGYARGWPERFELIQRTLGQRIEETPAEDPEVRWAWRRMRAARGAVGVGALAAEVGWSRRHFVDRFSRQVGLAPKPAAQLVRFRHALGLLGGPGSIADVASAAGYADHSHLVRECRRLADTTPSALRAELAAAQQVTIVQDQEPVGA